MLTSQASWARNAQKFSLIVFLGMLGVATMASAANLRVATDLTRALHQKGEPYIECVFAGIDHSYHLVSVPWKRAQLGTKKGTYDAFFLATRNDERDKYAIHSDEIFSIEWLYVVRKDSGLSPDHPAFYDSSFSANIGTARYRWLEKKLASGKIKELFSGPAESFKTLNMLHFGRIDVTLENNVNLEKAFEISGVPQTDFLTFPVFETSAGVYFSKAFLKQYPGFLQEFNESIKGCKDL